jgi:crotonobetainyl-CoA:carnitine CoA-transferase CaiB-like acyl-CoA transferase
VLREVLETEFIKYDANDLLARMNARGVLCAPLYNYSQVLADPQVKHMEWVQDMALPNGVASKTVISPQRVSGRRLDVRSGPPALGAHTAEILAELEKVK